MMTKTVHAASLAAMLLLGLAAPAGAAPLPDQGRTAMAEARPAATSVVALAEPDDDATNCTKIRRRLWVDGEGWIVRRVTTCR